MAFKTFVKAVPEIILRVGDWEVCLPDADHVVSSNAQGYRYRHLDPDGTGPLLPPGAWFVDVNFARQRLRAHFRDADLGMFGIGDVPIVVSFGINGDENAVEVLALRRGNRVQYR